MTRPNPVRVVGAAALCAVLLFTEGCKSGKKAEEETFGPTPTPAAMATAKPKPRLELGLNISAGGAGETSLFVLSLFCGSLRQEELDNAVKKEGEKLKIEPVRVSIPKGSWASVDFRTLGGETSGTKEAREKLRGVVLVGAPESENISLGPRDTLAALYRIPSTDLPPPETLVQAEMKTDQGAILSDPVPVPRPPESAKGILLRKAEICLKLKSTAEAKAAAEEIIGHFPEEPAGYWIKGQALEAEGLLAEALKECRAALEKALAQKDAPSHEPPLPIIVKIRDLEEKISGTKK